MNVYLVLQSIVLKNGGNAHLVFASFQASSSVQLLLSFGRRERS